MKKQSEAPKSHILIATRIPKELRFRLQKLSEISGVPQTRIVVDSLILYLEEWETRLGEGAK